MPTTPSTAKRQHDFAAALLDPAQPLPEGLVGPDGRPSLKRFNVYRNNVVAGLTATLKDAFPAVARIVGEEFFLAMGRIYVALDPPASPIMLDYGRGFADFIETFEPAASLPYLADVARIERAWAEAYHAAEAEPIESAAFTRIRAGDLPYMRVTLHPSLRIVRSSFPALTIWQMNIANGEPAEVDISAGGEDTLLLRPGPDVEARALPPGAAVFITALGKGRTMIDAMKQALGDSPRFDLPTCLSGLMAASAFTTFAITSGNGSA